MREIQLTVDVLTDEAADSDDATLERDDGDGLSLREALAASAGDALTEIQFAGALAGNQVLLSGGPLQIDHDIYLDGDTDGDGVGDVTLFGDVEEPLLVFGAGDVTASLAAITISTDGRGQELIGTTAVRIDADRVTLSNSALIMAESLLELSGIVYDNSAPIMVHGDDFAFHNESSGQIVSGGNYGIRATIAAAGNPYPTGTVITNDGFIQSSDDAIQIPAGRIINRGIITTTNDFWLENYFSNVDTRANGVSIYETAFGADFVVPRRGVYTITNEAPGLIEGREAGIRVSGGGVIENAGLVVGAINGILVNGNQYYQTDLSISNSGEVGLRYFDEGQFLVADFAVAIETLEIGEIRIENSGTIASVHGGVFSLKGVTLINEIGGVIRGTTEQFDPSNYLGFNQNPISGFDSGAFVGGDFEDFGDLPDAALLIDHITNYGLIDGLVDTGLGDDVILNFGTITGEVILGAGDDLFDGAVGDESVIGSGGDDTLLGQGGDDTLLGYADDDTLVGGSGADYIVGGDGNDLLVGDGVL